MKRNVDNGTSSTYWMTYMIVENTDNELIPLYDSTRTPIFFKPTEILENEVKIAVENKANPDEEITIQSSSPIKIFGFSINISETYDIHSTMDEVKLLIDMEKYGAKRRRKNDTDMVNWENEQVNIIRRNQWIGSRFIVVVAYGEFDKECQVYVTNSTKSFNNDHFTSVSHSLNQKYFP